MTMLFDFVHINFKTVEILDLISSPYILSLLGARFIINMKEVGEQGLNNGVNWQEESTVSEIEFAIPALHIKDSVKTPTRSEEAYMTEEAEIFEVPA